MVFVLANPLVLAGLFVFLLADLLIELRSRNLSFLVFLQLCEDIKGIYEGYSNLSKIGGFIPGLPARQRCPVQILSPPSDHATRGSRNPDVITRFVEVASITGKLRPRSGQQYAKLVLLLLIMGEFGILFSCVNDIYVPLY